ncbi:MAG: RNA polymerase sigma factor [Deltaproteobacteria bacterium]|nr:RNA polymerase sigma factor [Deltaproteobacteria bacterium]
MDDDTRDLALLEQWLDGRPEAGQELFSRHYDALYRFFDRKIDGDVEDLVHDTFIRFERVTSTFQRASTLRTYLFGIANKLLLEFLRKKAKAQGRNVDFSVESVGEVGGSPASHLERKQEHQLLRLALREIPLESQVLLELYMFEEFTGGQLAVIMEAPEDTVRSRISRAKRLLERKMNEIATDPDQLHDALATLSTWLERIGREARVRYPGIPGDDADRC